MLEIDAESFIAVKGIKAHGKRVTTYEVGHVEELEPLRQPDPQDNGGDDGEPTSEDNGGDLDPDAGKSQQQVIDEITGQLNLFDHDDH